MPARRKARPRRPTTTKRPAPGRSDRRQKALDRLMREVAQTVQQSGTAKAIFGEPVRSDARTIIPVSSMSVWIGGGEGGDVDEQGTHKGGGRGGGAMLSCTPVGFIVEGPDGVAFEPIGSRLGLADLLPVPVRLVAKLFRLF